MNLILSCISQFQYHIEMYSYKTFYSFERIQDRGLIRIAMHKFLQIWRIKKTTAFQMLSVSNKLREKTYHSIILIFYLRICRQFVISKTSFLSNITICMFFYNHNCQHIKNAYPSKDFEIFNDLTTKEFKGKAYETFFTP